MNERQPEHTVPRSVGRPPLVLLADSQALLVPGPGQAPFWRCWLPSAGATRAAYLGASNGDEPAYFELCRYALATAGVLDVRHVRAVADPQSAAWLDSAELLVLAGGDPLRGLAAWRALGYERSIAARVRAGALLLGVSAGAVQLGRAWRDPAGGDQAMLGLVPYLIDAHAEPAWTALRAQVASSPPATSGLGVPRGGAVLVHPDGGLSAVGRAAPLFEHVGAGGLRVATLEPGRPA